MVTPPKLLSGRGPFLHTPRSTRWMMWQVVVALAPIGVVSVVFFGVRALMVVALSVVTAWTADLLGRKLNKQPLDLTDASPLITGLLVAYMLPPNAPWFVPVVGSLYAVLLGKQLFGGLGLNLFNPAIVGRVLLQWTFPDALNLTHYPVPLTVDAVSGASPLFAGAGAQQARLTTLISGVHGGSIGETCVALIALCGLYLIYQRVIDWKVPLLCLLSVFVLALFLPAPDKYAGHAPYLVHNPLYHVFSGGVMLAAFFFITDPVTTPLTAFGRAVFAIGVGLLTLLIRFYGVYPEGVAYAVLVMNGVTPAINRLTYPKPLGYPAKELVQ